VPILNLFRQVFSKSLSHSFRYWSKCFWVGATISAPPTTNNPAANVPPPKVNTIAATGASSKIIHPQEDVSLEEIRTRNPKYSKGSWQKNDDRGSTSSTMSSEVRVMDDNKNVLICFYYFVFRKMSYSKIFSCQ